MKTRPIVILAGIGLAAAVATILIKRRQSDAGPPTVYVYDIEFTVTDQAGGAVMPGVAVSLVGGDSAMTDEAGIAVITVDAPGVYTFTLDLSDYELYEGTVTVTEG